MNEKEFFNDIRTFCKTVGFCVEISTVEYFLFKDSQPSIEP